MASEPRLITPPTTEPVTLAQLKDHLSIEHADFDALITTKGKAARDECEQIIGRKLIAQQWEIPFDGFGCELRLPWSPLISVDKVEYVPYGSTDDTLVELADSVYETRLRGNPPTIRARYMQWFPDAKPIYDAVIVTATFGYENPATIPEGVIAAIMQYTGDLFRDRESSVIGLQYMEKQQAAGIMALLRPHRARAVRR